jgi:hypothetical protein
MYESITSQGPDVPLDDARRLRGIGLQVSVLALLGFLG